MILSQEEYYQYIEGKNELEAELKALAKQWADTICWEGTKEDVQQHVQQVRNIREQLDAIEADMEETRSNTSAVELYKWRTEWQAYLEKKQTEGK